MLAAFLFIIYLGLACFFITRIKLVKQSGLGIKLILGLFLVRIMAGCILGLVNYYLLHGSTDYDGYNRMGYLEYEMLFSHPNKFFTDIFVSNYSDTGDFFGSSGSYWNDLRTNIILKLIGIADIFSRGNYFINSIFFNFIAFIANVSLYRAFIHVFPAKKTAVIIGTFLLPSMLYFSSGVHKDLFVFTGLCLFCYYLYFSFEDKFTVKRIIGILFSFLLILFIRNFIAILLLPGVAAWWLSKKLREKKQVKPLFAFAAVTVACAIVAITLHYIMPTRDPLKIIADKQLAFLQLETASTQYKKIDTLQSTIMSFAKATPLALRHSFLSPLPGEFYQVYTNLFSIEIIVYLILALLAIFSSTKQQLFTKDFVLFGLMTALLIFLFTGYISTAAGALIRYRSIYFPFLLVPILSNLKWIKNNYIKI